VALKPQNYIYILNLADSNRRLGRSEEAETEYREGMDLALSELSINPRSGYVRGFVAYFASRRGIRDRAKDEIAQALQLSPNDNRVILRAVLTYEALGLRDQAIAALGGATAQLLRELGREPDLVEFSTDSRFRRLVAGDSKGDR
jgi:tetratricopeptide (TPR) repeat protein